MKGGKFTEIKDFFKQFVQGFRELIFPPKCLLCHEIGEPILCNSCLEKIPLIEPPYCQGCGKPFSPLAKGGNLCKDCRRNYFHFDFARAIGTYQGVLRECILLFKYNGRKALAQPLGKLMAEYIKEGAIFRNADRTTSQLDLFPQDIDFIIPVPLHPRRQRERGFNQSELIAQVIAQELGIPLRTDILIRVKNTMSQFSLTQRQRRENIKGAFQIAKASQGIAGKNILLIDDVLTTGATVNECAKTLRKAKVGKIFVLTLATGQ